MTERILVKKEGACVKGLERFNILVVATGKKINFEEKKSKLKERRVELASASEDTNMLTIRIDELDPDLAMIVRTIYVRMLKRLAAEMGPDEKEAADEEEPVKNCLTTF